MQESLSAISNTITWYRQNRNASPRELIEALVSITTHLYTLEECRSEYKKSFEAKVYEYTNEGQSVARSVNMAEIEVPELYRLRRIMEAAYEVVGALRTHISFLKQELNTNI